MKTGTISNKRFSEMSMRIDPSLYLSDGIKIREELKNLPYKLLSVEKCASDVFLGNIFSRIFVKDKNHGMTYLAASDTVLSNLETGRYLANSQVQKLKHLCLKKDWILITCSGTLGNVTYTNNCFEDKIATHDLIRVIPNDSNIKKGVLYAFLSSRYGYYQITQSQFGGVVKHINDKDVKGIIIPLFPDSFQKEVDNLVLESARLREEAAASLKVAHRIFEENIDTSSVTKCHKISMNSLLSAHNKRFEASFCVSRNRQIYNFITSELPYETLGELSSNIFKPNIFKRSYVTHKGVQLLGGADIMNAIPQTKKLISKKQVENIIDLKIEKDWILITRAGTIGNTIYVDNQLSSKVVSEDVLRVVPKKFPGYIFAFLTSLIGHELITLYTYGSVIQHIEAAHVERIPIPMLDTMLMTRVENLVQEYVSKIEKAKENELLAIQMIEQEIERWNNNN